MTKIQAIVKVPKGKYCRNDTPWNQIKTCPVLGGYNLTYCQLFQVRLQFDFEVTEEKTIYTPIKCPACIEAIITDEAS